jgi:hypothetical protein
MIIFFKIKQQCEEKTPIFSPNISAEKIITLVPGTVGFFPKGPFTRN